MRPSGLATALLSVFLVGCEAVSLDEPSEVAPEVAARSDEPLTAPVVLAVEAPVPAGALDDLSPLSDPAGALAAPEIYRGTGVFARRPARRASDIAIESDGRVTLNFANAEIREVVDVVLGETLGVSYIIDPKVQGQVTARTSRPIPRAAVIPALENILAMNGAALTLDDGIYKVVTLQQAASSLTTPVVAPTRADLARGFAIHVIPLRFAAAQAVADILKPFVGPGRVLRVDAARNLLVFAGTGTEAADLLDMVTVFDVDWMAGMSFALFPVQVADAKSLVAELETVFLEGDSPLAGVVRFVPIERLNAVLAISPQPAYLERAETWIDRLDQGAGGARRRIFVYHVQNGRAADLAAWPHRVWLSNLQRRRP